MLHFRFHYKMMMAWYENNPLDGLSAARKISVGIPVGEELQQQVAKAEEVVKGLAVPEADREVNCQS